jgi:spore maturation protein CgeB
MVKSGYSPSVRLFEAAACGVPIISDRWSGIEHFFEPGREILLADRSEDVLAFLQHLEAAEVRAISERARTRVLREHTSKTRARQLSHYLTELADGRAPRLRGVARDPASRFAGPDSSSRSVREPTPMTDS